MADSANDFDELTGCKVPAGGETVTTSFEPWSYPNFSERFASAVGDAAVELNNSAEWHARRADMMDAPFDPKQPPEIVYPD